MPPGRRWAGQIIRPPRSKCSWKRAGCSKPWNRRHCEWMAQGHTSECWISPCLDRAWHCFASTGSRHKPLYRFNTDTHKRELAKLAKALEETSGGAASGGFVRGAGTCAACGKSVTARRSEILSGPLGLNRVEDRGREIVHLPNELN